MKVITVQAPDNPLLTGELTLPGSKSLTNRALVVGAQQNRPLQLNNFSTAEDSAVVLQFLHQLGYTSKLVLNQLTLQPPAGPVQALTRQVQLAQAGTAFRFIAALCSTVPGTFLLQGAPRLAQRAIQPLLAALQVAGATSSWPRGEGHFPLVVQGNANFRPSYLAIDAQQSSQLLSALLLLAPTLPTGAVVAVKGKVASQPYLTMTVGLLQAMGYSWQQQNNQFILQAITGAMPSSYTIEADWSAASYWLALAATRRCKLKLLGLQAESLQGDAAQLSIFQQWGLKFQFRENFLLVENTQGCLVPAFNLNFAAMPDLAPTFAALALFAPGPCTLTGLETLVAKESDRLTALTTELTALGQQVGHGKDHLRINPQQPVVMYRPLRTYEDHRLAMSFALMAQILRTVELENPDVVNKSYPLFWKQLSLLGFHVNSE